MHISYHIGLIFILNYFDFFSEILKGIYNYTILSKAGKHFYKVLSIMLNVINNERRNRNDMINEKFDKIYNNIYHLYGS